MTTLALVKEHEDVITSYYNLKNVLLLSLGKPQKMSIVKYSVPALVTVSVLVLALIFKFSNWKFWNLGNQSTGPEVNGVSESSSSAESVSEKPKETSPSALPKTLDKALVTMRVENGVGIAGTAGKAKTAIEAYGYKVVEIGNASAFDFANTQVKIKKSKADYIELLKKDLSVLYEVTVSDWLEEGKSYDVLIIVGKK